MRKDNLIAQIEVKDLDFYFNLNKGDIVYIRDLKHQAYKLIREAESREDVKVYKGNSSRKTAKMKWLQHLTFGLNTPTTIAINLSNGVRILEYGMFDKESQASEEEMMSLIEILNGYDNQISGCKIIGKMLSSQVAAIPESLDEVSDDNYYMLGESFRGGANYVVSKDLIPFETHIDYHQLYASVMITHNFPYLNPEIVDGYYPHEFGIYEIGFGQAKLKKNGFPIIPAWCADEGFDTAMFGASGKWTDLRILRCICEPDLKLLYENYDVEDLVITKTLYYPFSFSGKKVFQDIVNTIYTNRQTTTGAIKRFWKLMNEYLAGYFERTVRAGKGWWSGLKAPDDFASNKAYNPIIGVFITAYGRQKLNVLLHMVDHDKVIGYDTDCIFYRGRKEEVPQNVLKLFGDGVGQLHFDGIYKNVIHKASKWYYGYDLESNSDFIKAAGFSKTGEYWEWNSEKQEWTIKEVVKNAK